MGKKQIKKLALIAGVGELPLLLAREAASSGIELISVVFHRSSYELLKPVSSKTYKFGIGQVGKTVQTLVKEGVSHAVFSGKIEKSLLYRNPLLDLTAIKILSSLKDKKDDTIMLAIVERLEEEGIKVVSQTLYLKDNLPPKGLICGREPGSAQKKDIEFGLKVAKEIARLDIGQTVVVKNQAVMAIEAIEGTDEAIKRGCSLCVKGGVVVKVSKPQQDPRFDVPTVGKKTLLSMAESKGALLAVEADKTILVNRNETIETAKRHKITVIAV